MAWPGVGPRWSLRGPPQWQGGPPSSGSFLAEVTGDVGLGRGKPATLWERPACTPDHTFRRTPRPEAAPLSELDLVSSPSGGSGSGDGLRACVLSWLWVAAQSP